MKVFFVAFLALAVGASALPEEYGVENWEQRNLVEETIKRGIDRVRRWIINNNLDPAQINRIAFENSPRPGLDYMVWIQDLNLIGASEILAERVEWAGNRLRLTVVLPRIYFSLGNGGIDINVDGRRLRADLSGDFQMTRAVVTFDVNVNLIGGISIRDLRASVRIQRIWSDARVVINGNDYSRQVNTFINVRVPLWLQANQEQIDRILSTVLKSLINWILNR